MRLERTKHCNNKNLQAKTKLFHKFRQFYHVRLDFKIQFHTVAQYSANNDGKQNNYESSSSTKRARR